jgi:hypothetical protein
VFVVELLNAAKQVGRHQALQARPNERSVLRLVSAILIEVDEQWPAGKRYLPAESD